MRKPRTAAALTPTYYTDNNKLKQPQSAIVAIDPKTGYIKAMIGGRGTDLTGALAERQPGSAFKPFVYLNALEHGATPNDIVDDSPIPGSWNPQNYDRRSCRQDDYPSGPHLFVQHSSHQDQ